MAMKLALSSTALAEWDFAELAQQSRALRVSAVELPASHDGVTASATNALWTDPVKISSQLAGIDVAALTTAVVTELDEVIKTAARLRCPLVRVLRSPQTPRADFLRSVRQSAEHAAGAGVTLLLENQPRLESSIRLWRALDDIAHANVAACLHLRSMTLAGEAPAMVVPTLNSRIRMVRICAADTAITPAVLNRLAGIGFTGTIVAEASDPAELATVAELLQAMKLPAGQTQKS